MRRSSHESLKNDLQDQNQIRTTTHYAEHGKEESLVDLEHKQSARTSRCGSSESQGARLPSTARDQGCSDGRASFKLLKSYKCRLASLKSETQSRADRTSSSTSAPRGDSEKTILLRAVHSDSSLQSNADDYSHMRFRVNKTSRTSSMHSKHSGAYSRSHWLAQSAEDLAAPLHSVHPDKATRRRHSDEPDVQKLSRGSTSSSTGGALRSGMQRRGSSILQSVRKRGSLMSTAADSNVAVSSGSAFYASQIMARRTLKPEVVRAKPRPESTNSRQSIQSNQPEGAGIRVGSGQSLRSGLVLVFSAFASLLGLLMSVQTYVSLVMAPAKLVAVCLSSQPPWSGEPSATENGRRHSFCEHGKGQIKSQRRRPSTEDMWAMEALALNYDFSV